MIENKLELDEYDKKVINTYRNWIEDWQIEEKRLLSKLEQVRESIKEYKDYIDEILGEEAV